MSFLPSAVSDPAYRHVSQNDKTGKHHGRDSTVDWVGALALDGKFMTLAQQLVYSFQVSSLCLTDGMSSGSWAYIIRPARQLRNFGDMLLGCRIT